MRHSLFKVENLTKSFSPTRGSFQKSENLTVAIRGISFEMRSGETLGIVGESGCGKSTLARCLARLLDVDTGRIEFEGQDITYLNGRDLQSLRRQIQIIFQDPFSSLSPRMTVAMLIEEPMLVHRLFTSSKDRLEKSKQLLEMVGLPSDALQKYPHEFSGGQRQRISIARALAVMPKVLICDEPVSALDVSIQGQVINLLMDLQQKLELSYIFIGHDLRVVEQVSSKVAVMYSGRFVELASTQELFRNPKHPYTQALLSSIPIPDPNPEYRKRRAVLSGEVPSPTNPPPGCHFHPRCPLAIDNCRGIIPPLEEKTIGHLAACIRVATPDR